MTITFDFDNTYARDLDGFYAPQAPETVAAPGILRLNRELAAELGLDADALDTPAGAEVLAGNRVPEGASPLAQAYAGHQFGGFNPQLGDGRAVLLGEIVTPDGRRVDIQLKGSGRTPFSRGGDGRAALGPVLREYLMSEAMHALGVPTTRALAAVTTGEQVVRERPLPGAVLTRVAASHLRVGTFEFFAARGLTPFVEQLVDYAVRRHDPDLVGTDAPALELLRRVAERQAELVAQWMHLGFVHGVMNTDNTAISGETIDYGPCAFVEAHDPSAVFSSIDTGGRYAYGNQPAIARWNLARLAEAMLPAIGTDPEASREAAAEVVDGFIARYEAAWLAGARRKLGLTTERDDDAELAREWEALLGREHIDHTLGWRWLGSDPDRLRDQVVDRDALTAWLARWHERCDLEPTSPDERAEQMRLANPLVIPRNHRVEEVLAAAHEGDLEPFDRLLEAVRRPFDDDPSVADLAQPAPVDFTETYRTFCGT